MQTAPTEFLYLVLRDALLYDVKAFEDQAERAYLEGLIREPERHWSVHEVVCAGGVH